MTHFSPAADWPVLRKYDGDHLGKIAMPLGGIGTGTVSLGGKGDLRDWELCNAPDKGFVPFSDLDETRRVAPFFCVRCCDPSGRIDARMLEGPVELTDYEGQFGTRVPNHGFPRFRDAEFHAAYPFGQVVLSDPEMPVRARLKAFNPLVPADPEASGLPVAVLTYELENLSGEELDVSVCGTLPNYIGDENGCSPVPHEAGGFAGARGNRNELREAAGLKGIFMHAPELPADCRHKGDISLSTLSDGTVTSRTAWKDMGWGGTKLDFWQDFTEDGRIEERTSVSDRPAASLCVQQRLPAGEKTEITFLITWHFPNR
ncbi:GH116 family glycosyl-hydrolase, partial [Pontiella sp.]|uniref:GH116 family glycosyl-hydrolase n=1 Tax=Pontiella sp. TaxID=2837462 RepID=UPI003565E298